MVGGPVFAIGEMYHVFNRGLDRRITFNDKFDFRRAVLTADYYRFDQDDFSLSKALKLNVSDRAAFFGQIRSSCPKMIEILGYCFMPNHFHFLLKQVIDAGVSRFVSKFENSYTKYFDLKNERVGPLFQGVFKAVRIESNEQLIHVSRYIHINPVVSFLVKVDKLNEYQWSSLPEYLGLVSGICDKSIILGQFESVESYRSFLHDQIDYGRQMAAIKHLLLE